MPLARRAEASTLPATCCIVLQRVYVAIATTLLRGLHAPSIKVRARVG